MPIEIADYSDKWPEAFVREQSQLHESIGALLQAIEHIGSTSVPGLAAKPIIDIMPGVMEEDYLDQCVIPLQGLGYTYISRYESEMPFRRYFSKQPTSAEQFGVHIHVVKYGGEFWNRHIRFRDLLRTDETVRFQYENLKRSLAPLFNDQNDYAGAKTDFIQAALARQDL